MLSKKQQRRVIEWLRMLHRSDFPKELSERAMARETLRLLGNIVIRPLAPRLAETNELFLIFPIAKLYLALADLDRGKTWQIVRPSSKAGRPEGTGVSPNVRGGAAAAMEILMTRAKMSAEQAGRLVARMLDKRSIRLPGNRSIEWKTVQAWRRKIKSDRAFSLVDTDVYRHCLMGAALDKLGGIGQDGNRQFEPLDSPKKLAEDALDTGISGSPPSLWGLDRLGT